MVWRCGRRQHVCNWRGGTMRTPWKQRAMRQSLEIKKSSQNWCFYLRSHNLGQIMWSQQIPSAVQFRSQVICKMWNTSLARVSPGTAKEEQASVEGKHRTRKNSQSNLFPTQSVSHGEVTHGTTVDCSSGNVTVINRGHTNHSDCS